MTDSSTTTAPILDLIAGDCWVGGQLRRGIKDVSVTSSLMKSLTLVGVARVGEARPTLSMFIRTIEAFL